MLIPRFSIRWLLGLTTFSAFVSLVLSYAVRGQAWAIGVVAGLWTLVVTFVFFAIAFLTAWLIARTQSSFRPQVEQSTNDETTAASESLPPLPSPNPFDLPPPITG